MAPIIMGGMPARMHPIAAKNDMYMADFSVFEDRTR
jgi:hypothetical protein